MDMETEIVEMETKIVRLGMQMEMEGCSNIRFDSFNFSRITIEFSVQPRLNNVMGGFLMIIDEIQ